MTKTLIVDGNFLLKQSYSVEGQNTTYLFITTLRKVIAQICPDKVFVSWDGEMGGYLRYQMYEAYKANRKNKSWFKDTIGLTESQVHRIETEKKELVYHKTNIQNYLEELFIRQIELPKIESDDIISYIVRKYHIDNNIYIFTKDRDFLQLLKYDNVNIIFADKYYNVEKDNGFSEKMYTIINKKNMSNYIDVHIENIALVKSIIGDSSDNIEGIRLFTENKLLKDIPELKHIKISFEQIDNFYKEKNDLDYFNFKNQITNKVYNKIIEYKFTHNEGKLYYQNRYKVIYLCDIESVNFSDKTLFELLKLKKVNKVIIDYIIDFLKTEKMFNDYNIFDTNRRLMSLLDNYFLSEQEIEQIDDYFTLPLEYKDENDNIIRGGKNLINIMKQQNFLKNFSYKISETTYVEVYKQYIIPFVRIVNFEKKV